MNGDATKTFLYVELHHLLRLRNVGAVVSSHSDVSDKTDALQGVRGYARRCATLDAVTEGAMEVRTASETVQAPVADADRWCEAARELVQSIRSASRQAFAANDLLYPPAYPKWRGVLWNIRRVGRGKRRRAQYRAAWERLHDELLTAYRTYDERAGDLAAFVRAEQDRRERDRRQREQEKLRGERLRREEWAPAMADPDARIWTWRLETYGRTRTFVIWVPALDQLPEPGSRELHDAPPRPTATAREIQEPSLHENGRSIPTPPSPGVWKPLVCCASGRTVCAATKRHPGRS